MPKNKQLTEQLLVRKLEKLTREFKRDFGALEKTFMAARRELQKTIDKKNLAQVKKALSF